jgi:hypothetical protein
MRGIDALTVGDTVVDRMMVAANYTPPEDNKNIFL